MCPCPCVCASLSHDVRAFVHAEGATSSADTAAGPAAAASAASNGRPGGGVGGGTAPGDTTLQLSREDEELFLGDSGSDLDDDDAALDELEASLTGAKL